MLDTIRGCRRAIAQGALPASDAAMVEELRALEELKCAAEARQARLAAALPASPGTAHQVALARRESPHRGRRHLGLARVLITEMPETMAAFTAGRITEWHATLLARETACLSVDDRALVDRAVAGSPEAVAELERSTPRQAAEAARGLASRLDPAGCVKRRRQAESDRHVSIRPAPDTMAWVTALLPVAQGVAVWATLSRAADAARATGDPRGRGQLMADALVAAVTAGQPAVADEPAPAPGALAVNLLVSDKVLFGEVEGEAWLDGYGAIPAELARELTRGAGCGGSQVSLRRLYCDAEGEIVAADSRSRTFPAGLAQLIRLRDRTCRIPWCDAPIRHIDHVRGVSEGGATAAENGQGLCEACNYAKSQPGWTSRTVPGPRHTVVTTTPTGHSHRSRAPDPRPPDVADLSVASGTTTRFGRLATSR